jgi:hypothetical protein
MVRPPIEAALRCRLPGIEKLGNGGDKLGRRKRLGQKDTVGNSCEPQSSALSPVM